MRERWVDINNFEGYQISNKGRVRKFWKRKHYPTGYGTYRILGDTPTIVPQSDNGKGYMQVEMYDNQRRRCTRKVHKLVADAFLPPPPDDDCEYTIDHIKSGPDGKKNNSISNLQWMPKSDNIRKAYEDGMCDERIERQRKPIIAHDLRTGEDIYFNSMSETCSKLGISYTCLYNCLRGHERRNKDFSFKLVSKEGVV